MLSAGTTAKHVPKVGAPDEQVKQTDKRAASKLSRRSMGSKRALRQWDGPLELRYDDLMTIPHEPEVNFEREVMRDVKNMAYGTNNNIEANYPKKSDAGDPRMTGDVEIKRMELMKYIDAMEAEIARSMKEAETERAERDKAEKAKIEVEGEREEFEEEVEEVLGELMVRQGGGRQGGGGRQEE